MESERGESMRVFSVNRRLAFGSAITTRHHVEQLRAMGVTHVLNLNRAFES